MEGPDFSAPGSVPPNPAPSQSPASAPSLTHAEPSGLTLTQVSGYPQSPEEEQAVMFSTLEAIFQRAEEVEGGVGVGELRAVSNDCEEGGIGGGRNIEALRNARAILDQMWWSQSKFMSKTAEVLADGSRDPEWRVPYGEAGILDFFLKVVDIDDVDQLLMLHSLRLIGNCCADTNSNRDRVVSQNYLMPIIKQLRNPTLVRIAIPVIYNICIDYEPAQEQATSSDLISELINLLYDQEILEGGGRDLLGYAGRLIELTASSPNGTDKSPENTVEILFSLATHPETGLDDFLTLTNSAVVHLSDVRFQRYMITQKSLETPLSILVESYSRFSESEDPVPSISNLDISNPASHSEEPENEKQLAQMRLTLIESLSEISALPEFAATYALDSPLIGSLRMWLTVPHTQLRVCSCLMLGNLARSDDICRTMVHGFRIHEPLLGILEEAKEPPALHAAIGFLKNLGLLADNKVVLGKSRLIEILSRLWALETVPLIQFASASLARQIISGSQENVARLLTPLSSDPDSPAHSRTYLSLLLSLHEKSDQLPIKIEIARTVTAICRALNSPLAPGLDLDIENLKDRLFRLHMKLVKPISVMVGQTKWPLIRSEGWFAFALIARHPEGAAMVSHALHGSDVFGVLLETVTGKQFPPGMLGEVSEDTIFESALPAGASAQPDAPDENGDAGDGEKKASDEQMLKIDRENALVLVNELLKNRGDHLSPIEYHILRDMLDGGSLQGSYSELIERAKASHEAISNHEHDRPVEGGMGGDYDVF